MRVQVNKFRCDHQSGRIDLNFAAKVTGGNGGNLLTANADAPNGIEAGLGIHHSATLQHNVVGLRSNK